MFESIKERLWGKPEPPPKEPEPIKILSQAELLAHSMVPLMSPRECIMIEITKSQQPLTPRTFLLTHWPYLKVANSLPDAVMLQRAALVPYRAQKANHGYRMMRVPLQDGWLFHIGTSTYPEPPTEPAEMYAYLDDPEWELVDRITHQLTPKGSLLVKRVCLATMSTVMDYHVINGIAFLRLKPPVVQNLYDTIAEAATSILGKK
jgi:hypothetical protein